VSDLLGQETIVFRTMAQALDSEQSGISFSEQHAVRPLFTLDEVRHMPEQAELLFVAGQRPIIARKLRYLADREFADLYEFRLGAIRMEGCPPAL
jgi:type IV secretion system protein VirD4